MKMQLIILPGGASFLCPAAIEAAERWQLSEQQVREMAEMLADRTEQSLPIIVSWPIEIVDLREPRP